jgi:glycosyltransferase involved in cell wall biosynthesis
LRLPYVLHLHGSNYNEFYSAIWFPIKAPIRRMFRRAAMVVVLGDVWRRFVHEELGVSADRIRLVPNAVPGPVRANAAFRLDPPMILFLGVVGERKGVDVLLDALASPGLLALDWTAVIAGDGEIGVYAKVAKQRGLAERVAFPGWCNDGQVRDYLRAGSILVLPSRGENLPLSLLEGMAYGLCPIVTPVGAVAEVIADGENGILVPIGDSDALALAITDVLHNPDKRTRLAIAARASYELFYDVRNYPARLGQVYRAVAETSHAGRALRSEFGRRPLASRTDEPRLPGNWSRRLMLKMQAGIAFTMRRRSGGA